jgi:hypothetical protein
LKKPHAKKKGKGAPIREDGRRAALLYLSPDVSKKLKLAAVELRTHAYEIVEEAIEDWLKKPRRKS